ncbi:cold-shock protein [Fulvivirga sedimenti]|uniref:Cold-shock protein n=1 Tax=Fulvivirga sedimenti TaxID=2879465 RepID=A0A9X1HLN0_9BACT|nr:cold-shock protein [Fulvivirga sedimenti]MCA6074514.1 cold-shock protein [Fulvivirga sedimenti]MCA6075691.1 cold-shock protein [Fulvivirga sedimenti]MCA6076819.1 cold-shock protein [Fulvivirga sedimenti]
MGRKNFNSFLKKQKAEQKRKKKAEKMQKKEDRKDQAPADLDDMIAYVDEFGNITSEPPEDADEVSKEDFREEDQDDKD